jgi:hypothetical protein
VGQLILFRFAIFRAGELRYFTVEIAETAHLPWRAVPGEKNKRKAEIKI